ncbi:MAG: hypothetical protein WKF84_18135 [Pyrinomonadaceae bacterium]
MSADRNGAAGADEFDDDDDDFPEMADLQFTFAQLLRETARRTEQSDINEEERVAVRNEVLLRNRFEAAFLTHELASDADFERLWPRLRDDILCENAASVYLQVMDALSPRS